MKFNESANPHYPGSKLIELEVDVLGVPLRFSHIIASEQYLRDPKGSNPLD